MQIRILNPLFLKANLRGLTRLTAILCVVCFSLSQGASQLTNSKRITGLNLSESPEGSRVTVAGDSLLDDYEAFRRGDRFYVRIPSADFVAAQPTFQGAGFTDVQVQKVGDSVVISFRLHPGASARVIGSASRLDVIFTSPNHFASNSGTTATRNRVTRNSPAEKNPSTRSGLRSGSDIHGPMPPGSPDVNPNYSVDIQASNPAVRTRASQPKAAPTNASVASATPLATPASVASPYPTTSPYSYTYPPAATYSATPAYPSAQTSEKIDLEGRSRAALQWFSTHKKLSAGIGVGATCLVVVALFLLFRRRRNRRAAMAKAARVQPKYSPEDELEVVFSSGHLDEPTITSHTRNVEYVAYEGLDENNSGHDFFFEDLTASASSDVAYNEVEAPTPLNAPSEGSWGYLPQSNPQAHKSRVQEEREVFEL